MTEPQDDPDRFTWQPGDLTETERSAEMQEAARRVLAERDSD